jgi:glycosyltransferase involved in cell wall biosynthesis
MKSSVKSVKKANQPKRTPRVSVLTPIYNTNPAHLRECIESVLAQTFTDFEFLILNDSPDNTEIEQIVKEYAKHDKRIKYFKNDRNMGITPSRNKLLDMARGEYIATFDHDDISVPNRLELQVDFLDKNPNVGVVSGLMEYFGEKNYIRQYPEYDADIKMYMTDNCSVSHTASMMRKSVLDENDIRYESYFSPGEDYRLFARLMEHTLFYNMQIPLVRYRFFAGQTTHTQAAKMARAHDEIQLYFINKFPAYREKYQRYISPRTVFRFSLFGIIPLFKIKHNWVLLFNFIPVFKLKWK